jgi:soluble lytic murein transglycosylase-like protein
MKRLLSLAWLAAMGIFVSPQISFAQHAEYDALVATHAQANGVPEALVHRVIVRESRYQPHLVGRGGTIGLMQIKLATARGLGYTGDAAGLRDPNTNLTYAVKYLAGAYRAANGDHRRAVGYYAGGYYYAAKRQHLAQSRHERVTQVDWQAGSPADARAQQVPMWQPVQKRQRVR